MDAFGSLELLKSEIKKEYSRQLETFQKESLKSFNEEKKRLIEYHEKEKTKLQAEIDKEERSIFRETLSEERLLAKKDFEEKRELIIDKVFDKATKKSSQTVLGSEYIRIVKTFVKSIDENANNPVEIIGGLEEYKLIFPDICIDKSLDGIIIKAENSIADFTFKSFIAGKRQELRYKVSKVMFEDVN